VDSTWIKVTLKSNNVMVVGVDPTGLQAGHYTGNITINNGTVVPVDYYISLKPSLFVMGGITPLNFNYTRQTPRGPAQPADQFVTIWSSQADFPVTVTETVTSPANGKWLAAASKKNLVTPITLEVVVNPTGLAAGSYQGTITISAPNATNSPLTIPVNLTVNQFPTSKAPEISSVTNGADNNQVAVAAGALISLTASQLDSCTDLPAVTFDGVAASGVTTAGNSLKLLVPDGVAGQSRTRVQLTCGDQASQAFDAPVADAAPGIFAGDGGVAVADAVALDSGSKAIRLYGTGFGQFGAIEVNGNPAPAAPVRVWLGGIEAHVISAAKSATLNGVVEMLVRVPDALDPGTMTLQVTSGDLTTHPGLTVTLN
jgi:uncharacterized protein (TIGR03437 family)